MTAYTYDEAREITVSREEARAEIQRHRADFAAFLTEVGDRQEYDGKEVLDWLGY
jgi:hypothetical protein